MPKTIYQSVFSKLRKVPMTDKVGVIKSNGGINEGDNAPANLAEGGLVIVESEDGLRTSEEKSNATTE